MSDSSGGKTLDYPHSQEQAEEYLRLSLRRLHEYRLSPNPVNYAVVYTAAAGMDDRLNEQLEALRQRGQPLTPEEAKDLFKRYIQDCEGQLMERYRGELLGIVAQTLGSLTDFAGVTAVAGNAFEDKAARLADSSSVKEVLGIVAELIADSRALARRARDMETAVASYVEEIGQLRAELKRARREADTDGLTGLLNRRAFWGSMESCLRKANAQLPVVCLLLLDIDYFKRVNDNHGHIVGDQVLRLLSKTLVSTVKGRDKVARIGGEEFAILLPDTMITGARSVAEDLRKRVAAEPIPVNSDGGKPAGVTISVGLAAYHKGESRDDFYHRCDQALYRAKRLGRNRVVVAD